MKPRSIGLKEIGIAIVLITLVMALLLISFMDTLNQAVQESCTCGDACGMIEHQTPPIIYVGWAGVIVMFLIGIVLFFKGGTLVGKADGKGAWFEKLKSLKDDEKMIYKLLIDADGTMFQSEIVEKTELSKVKVTRTLDKLESRRLLERRRRGLTNIIVLKN